LRQGKHGSGRTASGPYEEKSQPAGRGPHPRRDFGQRRVIRGAETYVFVDGGRAEKLASAPRGDRAASAGFGFPVANETNPNLEVAVPFIRPHNSEVDRGVRFVAVFRRNF
jgi:hemolysin activation/secretion protein